MALPRIETFTGAAGPLDSTWTQQRTGPTNTVNYDGAGNASSEGTTGFNPYAFDNSNPYAPNQYAKATIGGGISGSGTDFVIILTRASLAGDANYKNYYFKTDGASGAGHSELGQITADVPTVLLNVVATFVAGDVIELRSIGSKHEVFKNGVSVGSVVDNTHTSGSAGLGFDDQFGGDTPLISDWEGGDIGPVVGLTGTRRVGAARGPFDSRGFLKARKLDYTVGVPATVLNITADVGAIVLTGFAPSIGFGITSVDGSIVLTGFAPSAAFNFNLTGNTGSIVLAGFAPSIGFGLTGNTGSITLSGFAPSIGFGLTGNTGSIVLTGFAPTLSQAFNLTANVGSIVLSGFAPDVGLSGGGVLNITGATGNILLTGFAPSIAFGLMANVGSIVLTGFAPTLAQTFALTAGTGAIVLEGFAPTLDGVLFTPPVGGSGGKEIRGGLLYWLKLLQELEAQGIPEPEDEQQHEQFIAKRERLRAKVKQAQRAEAARKAAEMAAEREDEERILMLFLQYLSGNYGSN